MGRSDYSLKTLREQFRAQGLFYTPPELAQYIRSLLPDTVHRVYDPTCGRGSLLSVFDDDVEKFGQDIDAAAVEDARASLVNFHGAVGDVLADPAYINERFDAIVANPPFSIKWHGKADGYLAFAPAVPPASKADYAFILHILWMLGDHGTAVVLNAPGIGYRGGR
jgi:type I restriction enzyme M protein